MFKFALHILSILLFLPMSAPYALGDEMIGPRSLAEYKEARTQVHYRVKTARVAYANYTLMKAKFPQLRTLSRDQIDQWILDNFAYISEAQLKLSGIRISKAAVDLLKKQIFIHPDGYFRAAVAAITSPAQPQEGSDQLEEGAVDLKGSGSSSVNEAISSSVPNQVKEYLRILELPTEEARIKALNELRTADHSDGMMSLGEAIAEVSRQIAIQQSFDLHNHEHGTNFQTVENYFIIDLGIDILKKGQDSIPAAIVGRQAHFRGTNYLEVPTTIYTDAYGNRQATIYDSSVDFGGVVITQSDLQKTFGAIKNDPDVDPQKSIAWQFAHQTANYFRILRDTNITRARHGILEHLTTMLAPLAEKLRTLPAEDEQQEYVKYIYSRLRARDESARAIVVQKFIGFDLQYILPRLDDIFQLNLPRTVVGPIVKALLTDGRLAPTSADYKKVLKLAFKYDQTKELSEYVTGPALDAIRGARDLRSLSQIMRAQSHQDAGIRTKAAEMLLERDILQIMVVMPRVFLNSENPKSVIGPIIGRLLTDGRLQPGAVDYESILTRASTFVSAEAVINPVIAVLETRRDAASFETIKSIFIATQSEAVQQRILEAVLVRDLPEVLSFRQVMFADGTADVIATYVNALFNENRLSRTAPEYLSLLAETFEYSTRGNGVAKVRLAYLKAAFGLTTPGALENLRTTLAQYWDRGIKEQAVKNLLQWDKATVLSFLDFMVESRKHVMSPTDYYIVGLAKDPRITEAEFNAIAEKAYAVPIDKDSAWVLFPLFNWHVRSGWHLSFERIFRAMSDPHEDLRKMAVVEFLKKDIELIWNHLDQVLQLDFPKTVRGAVLTALLEDQRIPFTSDRHYELLTKARQFSVKNSQYVLNPMLEMVAADPDPRVLSFIMYCVNHDNDDVRPVAVNALVRRSTDVILSQLDTVFNTAKPRTVIGPVVAALLVGDHSTVGSEAYYQLAMRAVSYAGSHPEYVANAALDALKNDASPQATLVLMRALDQSPSVITGVVKLLQARAAEDIQKMLPDIENFIANLSQEKKAGMARGIRNMFRIIIENRLKSEAAPQVAVLQNILARLDKLSPDCEQPLKDSR